MASKALDYYFENIFLNSIFYIVLIYFCHFQVVYKDLMNSWFSRAFYMMVAISKINPPLLKQQFERKTETFISSLFI